MHELTEREIKDLPADERTNELVEQYVMCRGDPAREIVTFVVNEKVRISPVESIYVTPEQSYASDIKWAMYVVMVMRERGEPLFRLEYKDGEWETTFGHRFPNEYNHWQCYRGIANTAPLAIVRAALLAVVERGRRTSERATNTRYA